MTSNRFVCIHGHFYQPPRENPWLEEIERQDSAHPFHDWNERITAQCYEPNAASRFLDNEGNIVRITNNYSRISFNFGPTLLSWLEDYRPACYESILLADQEAREKYNGHGTAIAQAYNHLIMPLANRRDKITQIRWGIADFESRFNRHPEGMWLAETAVDTETLELLVDEGIKFTILAPRQASRIRAHHTDEWHDVSGGRIDPRRPYNCPLPGGRSIALFFYDGVIAQDVAFAGVLNSGEAFADRFMRAFPDDWGDTPCLVHIATDGETYGHHAHHGDMALAYCLNHLEANGQSRLTIYGEFLDIAPPVYDVEIFDNSSWSCIHGVERWRTNCGCNSGMHGGWQQEWRAPLRAAFDFVRDEVCAVYEKEAEPLLINAWKARDEYIEVVLNRDSDNVAAFLGRQAKVELGPEERIKVLKLLEIQRQAMLMYTSCGWFFDELSGIETVQTIQYAARAVQLCREVAGRDLEPEFTDKLEQAPSNLAETPNGRAIYEKYVKPAEIDLLRVAVHFAISSLFQDYDESTTLFCYEIERDRYDRLEVGKHRLVLGRARLASKITQEVDMVTLVVLHLGDHNIVAGVRHTVSDEVYESLVTELRGAFESGYVPQTIRLIDEHFGEHSYSMLHLFKDEQMRIMQQVLQPTFEEMERAFRRIYTHHGSLINVIHKASVPTPRVFRTTVEFLINSDFQKALESGRPDLNELERLAASAKQWKSELDFPTLNYDARRLVRQLALDFEADPSNAKELAYLVKLLGIVEGVGIDPDPWVAQNVYYKVSTRKEDIIRQLGGPNAEEASAWRKEFSALGPLLRVKGQA